MAQLEPERNRGGQPLGRASFRTTHWSVVLAAGNQHSPNREEALTTLCRTYWYPLYAYVRGCGFSPEDAQDTTQSFFASLMEADWLARADRERGRAKLSAK
jgi:hypothetical protein